MEGGLETQSTRKDKTFPMEGLFQLVAHKGKSDEENYHTRECVPPLL